MNQAEAADNFQILRDKVLSKGQKVTFETLKIAAREEMTEWLVAWFGEGGEAAGFASRAAKGPIFESATILTVASFYAEFEAQWDVMDPGRMRRSRLTDDQGLKGDKGEENTSEVAPEIHEAEIR